MRLVLSASCPDAKFSGEYPADLGRPAPCWGDILLPALRRIRNCGLATLFRKSSSAFAPRMIMCWRLNKSKKNGLKLQIPENETKMTFQSPFDDFVLNSLAAIAGLLGKLDYVASLREGKGAYNHWGLARVHGEDAAHQAASEAHRLLFSEVLSTPLAHLLEDAGKSRSACNPDLDHYLAYLSRRVPLLTPQGAGEGPVLHFNSVLRAISALAHARTHTNPQAS